MQNEDAQVKTRAGTCPLVITGGREMRFYVFLISLLFLSGCSALSTLGSLAGGGSGVNTAANVQAGKTNTQTVGTTENTSQKIVRPQARDIRQSSDKNSVRSDSVENLTVNEIPAWVILLLVLGWLFPSPGEIARYIRSLFSTNKKKADS